MLRVLFYLKDYAEDPGNVVCIIGSMGIFYEDGLVYINGQDGQIYVSIKKIKKEEFEKISEKMINDGSYRFVVDFPFTYENVAG